MTLDPSARLNNYIEHIIGKNCTEPEIIEIFRLIRHVIEKDRSRSEYQHLSLYCDWVQHIEIDRHPQGLAILERMNDIIVRHWSDTAGLVEEISHAFGLSQLRQEITRLFMSKEISTAIADSISNWRKFVGILLNDVCHKPIRLTEASKPARRKQIFDRMRERWAITGIEGVGPPRTLFVEAQSEDKDGMPAGFYWVIEVCAELTGNDHFRLRGGIHFAESRTDFLRP
jgi:hypothetical protein